MCFAFVSNQSELSHVYTLTLWKWRPLAATKLKMVPRRKYVLMVCNYQNSRLICKKHFRRTTRGSCYVPVFVCSFFARNSLFLSAILVSSSCTPHLLIHSHNDLHKFMGRICKSCRKVVSYRSVEGLSFVFNQIL